MGSGSGLGFSVSGFGGAKSGIGFSVSGFGGGRRRGGGGQGRGAEFGAGMFGEVEGILYFCKGSLRYETFTMFSAAGRVFWTARG